MRNDVPVESAAYMDRLECESNEFRRTGCGCDERWCIQLLVRCTAMCWMKAQWIALYLIVTVMCGDVDDETATNSDVFGFLRCECIVHDAATMDDQGM
jgi:hypothetical protein